MEGREDDGEARERGLQRRGERGRDSAKDVLLEAEDGSLVRDEHLAHPRGERASIQAPAGAHPAPALGLSATGRGRLGTHGGEGPRVVLARHEGLEAPERVSERDEPVEAGALGGIQEGEIGRDPEPLGRVVRRGREDDHLPGDAQEGEEHLGHHLSSRASLPARA